MFEDIADAVRVYRSTGAAHDRARDAGDLVAMRVAAERLREVAAHLRGVQRPELIHPLTMEWVSRGRDAAAHAHWTAEVERLV